MARLYLDDGLGRSVVLTISLPTMASAMAILFLLCFGGPRSSRKALQQVTVPIAATPIMCVIHAAIAAIAKER